MADYVYQYITQHTAYDQLNEGCKFTGYSSLDSGYESYHNMAVSSTNKYKKLTECIKQEDFDTLRKVFEEYGDIACEPNLTTTAAEINRLDILIFLIQQGCPWSPDVLLNATKHNNIDMIEYCLRTPSYEQKAFLEGSRILLERCPWHPECVNYLAQFNQLGYLELMYEIYNPSLTTNGVPFWPSTSLKNCETIAFLEFYLQRNPKWSSEDILGFIINGNLEAVQLFYKYYLEYKREFPNEIDLDFDVLHNNRFYINNNRGVGHLSKTKWCTYLLEDAVRFNQFDIVRFLVETKLSITDHILKQLNNNSYQLYKLCYNKMPKHCIEYKPESTSNWWIDFLSSLDDSRLTNLGLYSLLTLQKDLQTDLRTKYLMKEYSNVISKDVLKYCITDYLQ